MTDDEHYQIGRDITATLEAFQQALHEALSPASRFMNPDEITRSREALEMAEARLAKLKIRFAKR